LKQRQEFQQSPRDATATTHSPNRSGDSVMPRLIRVFLAVLPLLAGLPSGAALAQQGGCRPDGMQPTANVATTYCLV
jgi:hypothetical protein